MEREGREICKRTGLMCSIWLDLQECKEYDGYIHSMKYAEVIKASIAANSAGIDYSITTKVVNSPKGCNTVL